MKKKQEKKISTQLRIPAPLFKELKKMSLQSFRSQNQFIVDLIQDRMKLNQINKEVL